MKTISFEVPGDPVGSPRHREVVKQGMDGSIQRHRYAAPKGEIYAGKILGCFNRSAPGWIPTDGPVIMVITAYYSIPKSKPKAVQGGMLAGTIRPAKTPDYDNIGKIVGDALNMVAYRDDRQIFLGIVEKVYSERPRVEVALSVYDPGEPVCPASYDLWQPRK